jgi:hypothetical protein
VALATEVAMTRRTRSIALPFCLAAAALTAAGCADPGPTLPLADEAQVAAARISEPPAPSSRAAGESCWGQASAVFARLGLMGEHSSSFDNPRLGLRNLARQLYEANVIPDDSMAALGAFVAAELGLEIDACM